MARITLEYDARNSIAKSFIELIQKVGVFKTVPETTTKKKRTAIDEALDDIKNGRVYHCESLEDFKKMVENV